jgi:hypothetical protein
VFPAGRAALLLINPLDQVRLVEKIMAMGTGSDAVIRTELKVTYEARSDCLGLSNTTNWLDSLEFLFINCD